LLLYRLVRKVAERVNKKEPVEEPEYIKPDENTKVSTRSKVHQRCSYEMCDLQT